MRFLIRISYLGLFESVSQEACSISCVLLKAWVVPDQILIFEECVSFVFSPPSPCRWMVCGQMCVCVCVFSFLSVHSCVWEGPSPPSGWEFTSVGAVLVEFKKEDLLTFGQLKDVSITSALFWNLKPD